jgi:hypothetical protein
LAAKFSDSEITALINEGKPFPDGYQSRLQLKAKRGHRERELETLGLGGDRFRVILRQSMYNPVDFSIILALLPPGSNTLFRLRRYNGKSHEHTNLIERVTFFDFHIHSATERYQELGACEDAYAEPTDRFSDYQAALECLLEDCGFQYPRDSQLKLF